MADMTNRQHYPIGTIVSYEDPVNPKASGKIREIRIDRFAMQYVVEWDVPQQFRRPGVAEVTTEYLGYTTLTGRGWTIGGTK